MKILGISEYEEFQIITSIALLIIAILTYTHRKYPSCSLVKNRRLLAINYLPDGEPPLPYRLS